MTSKPNKPKAKRCKKHFTGDKYKKRVKEQGGYAPFTFTNDPSSPQYTFDFGEPDPLHQHPWQQRKPRIPRSKLLQGLIICLMSDGGVDAQYASLACSVNNIAKMIYDLRHEYEWYIPKAPWISRRNRWGYKSEDRADIYFLPLQYIMWVFEQYGGKDAFFALFHKESFPSKDPRTTITEKIMESAKRFADWKANNPQSSGYDAQYFGIQQKPYHPKP